MQVSMAGELLFGINCSWRSTFFMKPSIKPVILIAVTLVALLYTFRLHPVPQNKDYHFFADERTLAGFPNFLNVISNLPFLLVGGYGLMVLGKATVLKTIKIIYCILFTGIMLTGIGSAYYHYAPDNQTLVYDRLPMVLVFMAFLAATITSWIRVDAGKILIIPLLLVGMGSVLWWRHTELSGNGDLRLYGFVQYFPMLLIPLIFFLYANPVNNKGLWLLGNVIGWYIAAKLFERFDKAIYQLTHFISGHSLKHIAAAIATWYIVRFFQRKYGSHY